MSRPYPSVRRRKARSGRNASDENKMALVRASRVASAADTLFDRSDLTLRPPKVNITERPPKQLGNQIFWIRQGTVGTFGVSGSPTPGQFSKAFYLNDVFDAANLAKVFDQYCIYAVVISFELTSVVGTTTNTGTITTLIDFSDTTNVSSQSEAKSYSTAITQNLEHGKAITRYLEPCVSQTNYQSALVSGFGPSRAWIDILYPGTAHFGIKAYVSDNVPAISIQVNTEYIFGFRSSK